MTKKKTLTTQYDVAEHLRTPEEMAAYLEACLEEAAGAAAFITKALVPVTYTIWRGPMLRTCLLKLLFVLPFTLLSQLSSAEILFSSPAQFLSNRDAEIVAIVKTTSVRNVMALDQEGITPLLLSECFMEEEIEGSQSWSVGSKHVLAQWDACSTPQDPSAPPLLEDKRYLVWAHRTPMGITNVSYDWFALPDGCFLIRDHDQGAFIYWEGKCYLVSEIRKLLSDGGQITLDRIEDPDERIEKAEALIEKGHIDDVTSLIKGLMMIIRESEEQAKRSGEFQRMLARDKEADGDYLAYKAHQLRFYSLTLLRDLGLVSDYRRNAVDTLKELLYDDNSRVRFVAAASLADLGDPSGKDELVNAYENNIGGISTSGEQTGSGTAYFPGRFVHDDPQDSRATAAYYLSKIGDSRGSEYLDARAKMNAAEGTAKIGPPQSLQGLKEYLDNAEGIGPPPPLESLTPPGIENDEDFSESPKSSDQPEFVNVTEALESPDVEVRAQGIAQAGILGIEELYERVLELAIEGSGIEKLASISSLGFYDRALEEDFLRSLITDDGDLQTRLVALELATRRESARFFDATISMARELSDEFDVERDQYGYLIEGEDEFLMITRILNRMPRAGIPQEMIDNLKHENPEIRWMMVNGFWMGGDPVAASHVQTLKEDPNQEVVEAVERALATLGPPGN